MSTEPIAVYVFAHFRTADNRMYIAGSGDGIHWTEFGGPINTCYNGFGRDFDLIQWNNEWLTCYTASSKVVTCPAGQTPNSSNTTLSGTYSPIFALDSSPDLMPAVGSTAWTNIATPLVSLDTPYPVSAVWAPQFFVDSDGSLHIIVGANPEGAGLMQLFEMHPTNAELTAWSDPVPIAAGLESQMIDPELVLIDGVYHLFFCDNLTNYIEHATASSLLGTYTLIGSGDWAGWGEHVEAPELVQIDSAPTYRMYFDYYGYDDNEGGTGPQAYMFSETTDLTLETGWSTPAPVDSPFTLRHGGIVLSDDVGVACQLFGAMMFSPTHSPPHAEVGASAAQSIPADTVTQVELPTVIYDNDGMTVISGGVAGPGVSNELLINTPGRYVITAGVEWAADGTGTARCCQVQHNVFGGPTIAIMSDIRPPSTSSLVGGGQTVSRTRVLAKGDTLKLFVFHDATSAVELVADGSPNVDSPYLTATYLGP